MRKLIRADPLNVDLKNDWLSLQRVLARMEAEQGKKDAAKARLNNAIRTLDEMLAFDSSNQTWSKKRAKLNDDLEKIDSILLFH